MGKDEVLKLDLIRYLANHPEERFWQAIRNWSGYSLIYAGDTPETLEDTFYKEGK